MASDPVSVTDELPSLSQLHNQLENLQNEIKVMQSKSNVNNSTQKHKISKKKRRKDEKAEKSKHRISCESPKPEEKPSLEVRQNGENQNEKESGILENNSDSGSELLSRARQFILAAGEIEKMVKQSEASQGEREVECLEVTDHSKREAIEQSKESEDQLIQHTQEVITQQKRPNITKRSTLTDQKISNPEISVKPEEILEKKKQVEKFHELTQQRVRKRLEKQKELEQRKQKQEKEREEEMQKKKEEDAEMYRVAQREARKRFLQKKRVEEEAEEIARQKAVEEQLNRKKLFSHKAEELGGKTRKRITEYKLREIQAEREKIQVQDPKKELESVSSEENRALLIQLRRETEERLLKAEQKRREREEKEKEELEKQLISLKMVKNEEYLWIKGQKKKAPNLRVLLDSENNHMNTPKSNHQNDTKKHKKKHQNDTSEYMHEARALFNLSLNNCVQDTIPYPELELPESRVHTSKDTMESIESIFDAEIINQTKESIPEHVMGSPKSISASSAASKAYRKRKLWKRPSIPILPLNSYLESVIVQDNPHAKSNLSRKGTAQTIAEIPPNSKSPSRDPNNSPFYNLQSDVPPYPTKPFSNSARNGYSQLNMRTLRESPTLVNSARNLLSAGSNLQK